MPATAARGPSRRSSSATWAARSRRSTASPTATSRTTCPIPRCRRCSCLLAGATAGWLLTAVLTIPWWALLAVIPMSFDAIRTRRMGGTVRPWVVTVTSLAAGAALGATVVRWWAELPAGAQWSVAAALVVTAVVGRRTLHLAHATT